MGPGMFDGLEKLYRLAFLLLFLAVPLAIWKVVDIIIWVVKHLKVSVQ